MMHELCPDREFSLGPVYSDLGLTGAKRAILKPAQGSVLRTLNAPEPQPKPEPSGEGEDDGRGR